MTDTSTQEQAQPPRGTSAVDDAFDRLHRLDLRRDTDRRWFGGVCAGIAQRVDVDPLLIRAAAIALTIAGGLGLVVYLVLWFLLPDRYDRVLAERALRQGELWPVVLGVVTVLFVVGGLLSLGFGGNDWGGSLWILVPVALVVWFLATRSSRPGAQPWAAATPPPPYGSTPVPPPPPGGPTMSVPTTDPATTPYGGAPASAPPAPYGSPPAGYGRPGPYGDHPAPPVPPRPVAPPPPPQPPRPRRRRPSGYVGLVSLGLVIVLGGLGAALADPVGFPGGPAVLGSALALAGVAAVALALGLSGRASGFTGFLVVVLAFVTTVSTAAAHVPETTGGVGDRVWRPAVGTLPAEYSLGAGSAVLDLGGLATLTSGSAPERIETTIGVGELTIEIPDGLDVRVEGDAGVGEIRHERVGPDGTTVLDTRNGGDSSLDVRVGDDTPDLVVTAEIGIGDLIIQEQ